MGRRPGRNVHVCGRSHREGGEDAVGDCEGEAGARDILETGRGYLHGYSGRWKAGGRATLVVEADLARQPCRLGGGRMPDSDKRAHGKDACSVRRHVGVNQIRYVSLRGRANAQGRRSEL